MLAIPLYARVRETLKDRILEGSYGTGARLPSESQIMSEFGVSRVTVRQALRDLRDRGMVVSRQGKGSFVTEIKIPKDLGRLQGVGETVEDLGFHASSEVLKAEVKPATREIALALDVAAGADVYEIQRIRCINGNPVSLDISNYSPEIGVQLMRFDLSAMDIFPILEEELAIPLTVGDLVIEAVSSGADVAGKLHLADAAPVFRIERLVRTEGHKPVAFEYIYERLDAYRYQVRTARW